MWHIHASSVTGRSHQRSGLPLQDRTFVWTENGVTAAALADGAGSAALSQEGAESAVRQTAIFLCRHFEQLYGAETPAALRRSILTQAQEAVGCRAREMGVSPGELACTLMAVAVKEDRYLIFHIGDGIVAYQKEGAVKVASAPWNGEFANETVFLTSPDALRRCKVYKGTQPKLEGFCLMSDGSGGALYDKRRNRTAPILKILMQQVQLLDPYTVKEHLEGVMGEIISVRTQDDCSLILLTRKGERFGRWETMTSREKAAILGIQTRDRSKKRRQIRRYAEAYGITESEMI